MSRKVAFIVGSLREESLNLKMAKVLISLTPTSIQPELINISDLPLYNEELDTGDDIPQAWIRFRKQMSSCEGIIFFTPEYNRSIPGALKNAIDVGSRPYGQSIDSVASS